jgi:hypothetical protein
MPRGLWFLWDGPCGAVNPWRRKLLWNMDREPDGLGRRP